MTVRHEPQLVTHAKILTVIQADWYSKQKCCEVTKLILLAAQKDLDPEYTTNGDLLCQLKRH